MKGYRQAGWVFLCLVLAGCYLPSTPSPPLSPTQPPTLAPLPTPTSTPLPSPTPSPTPEPPLITPAAVETTIAAGEAATAALSPLCLRLQDTDDDGEGEWIGLYIQPSDPPRLLGFILDGGAWYDLFPPPGEDEDLGLGTYPSCDLTIRDLNGDGRTEIAVLGHAEVNTGLLHIFAWQEDRYRLLGAFIGKGGVRLTNEDGDGADEVIVRLRPEGSLVREIVYTWDGLDYAWTWDRYAWFFPDRPHPPVDDTPLHALASFYLALGDRDLSTAYSLLSPSVQAASRYEEWVSGFDTTMGVEVGAARVITQDETQATVAAQVQALDNVGGQVVVTLYDVEWLLIRMEGGWRLESGSAEPLDSWSLPY